MRERGNDAKRRRLPVTRLVIALAVALSAAVVSASPASANVSPETAACVVQVQQEAAQNPPPGANGANGEIVDSTARQFQGLAADGAVPALTAMLQALDLSTSPTVDAGAAGVQGGNDNWFGYHYRTMLQVGIWVMIPMLLMAIIHAVIKGSMQLLIRSVLINLPIAILGSVVAIQIVQLLIRIADGMSALFLRQLNRDLIPFMCEIQTGFYEFGRIWIVSAFLAVLIIGACFALLLVLILREASIYLATLFLPLGFAALVWPMMSNLLTGLFQFLFAMIFSEVVMVAAIGMGVAAVANTVGFGTAAGGGVTIPDGGPVAPPAENSAGQAVESPEDQSMLDWILMTSDAIMMLAIAAFSPAMLNGVVGHSAIGTDMANAFNQNLQRHSVVTIYNAGDRVAGIDRNIRGRPGQPGIPGNVVNYFRRPPTP